MLDQMKELSPTIKELTVENGIVKDLTQNADDFSNGRIRLTTNFVVFSTTVIWKIIDVIENMTCSNILDVQIQILEVGDQMSINIGVIAVVSGFSDLTLAQIFPHQ